MKRRLILVPFVLTAGCARHRAPATVTPTNQVALTATPEAIDSLWGQAMAQFRSGHWDKAATAFERLSLEFQPGDPRGPRSHFFLAECHFATKEQLQATREFRKVSDETPNDPLAPEALLRAADAYADLWRRPELDPTYGQTALATYQELINRYPGTSAATRAQAKIQDLNERFAIKTYKAALYYLRFKAYDSAILYLKNLLTTYPKSSVAPEALLRLVEAYRTLGYQEDLKETCGYLQRFHPDTPGAAQACPRPPPGT
jgi:outer membrane protein assembly factor BamD